MGYGIKDTALKVTKALPAGAASTTSDGIDLELGSKGDFIADCDIKLSAPVLTTVQLPDTKTMSYIIEHGDAANFSDAATLFPSALTQTGAGGAGAAAATFTGKLPTDVKRYVRAKCTGVATGDGSASSLTLELLF